MRGPREALLSGLRKGPRLRGAGPALQTRGGSAASGAAQGDAPGGGLSQAAPRAPLSGGREKGSAGSARAAQAQRGHPPNGGEGRGSGFATSRGPRAPTHAGSACPPPPRGATLARARQGRLQRPRGAADEAGLGRRRRRSAAWRAWEPGERAGERRPPPPPGGLGRRPPPASLGSRHKMAARRRGGAAKWRPGGGREREREGGLQRRGRRSPAAGRWCALRCPGERTRRQTPVQPGKSAPARHAAPPGLLSGRAPSLPPSRGAWRGLNFPRTSDAERRVRLGPSAGVGAASRSRLDPRARPAQPTVPGEEPRPSGSAPASALRRPPRCTAPEPDAASAVGAAGSARPGAQKASFRRPHRRARERRHAGQGQPSSWAGPSAGTVEAGRGGGAARGPARCLLPVKVAKESVAGQPLDGLRGWSRSRFAPPPRCRPRFPFPDLLF